MPTEPSSTELSRAAADLGPLLRFRTASLRGRSRSAVVFGLGTIVALTLLAGWLPAYLPGAAGAGRAHDVWLLLPSALTGVLLLSTVAAAASGGGRELVPREQAVAFPAQVPVLLWLALASSVAQLVSWTVEWVRRGRHGAWVVRVVAGLLALTSAVLVSTAGLVPTFEALPTDRVADAILHGAQGSWAGWLAGVSALAVAAAFSVGLGGLMASGVARRPTRDEVRGETAIRAPRENPTSDFAALVRTDRAGIWRSLPLRRGFVVLALVPGLMAVVGDPAWEMLCILPGLVASGAALLSGVNSWCLDGRGARWRDSLPFSARVAFASRAYVLSEVLLLAVLTTLALAGSRAGAPTASQLAAVLCATVVVTLQVAATALRWSVRRPFAVEVRSARATPAPPLVMVGYSTRLALSTTLTSVVFMTTATVPGWGWSVLFALPFLVFSADKLRRTSNEWANPEIRSLVVATVAS